MIFKISLGPLSVIVDCEAQVRSQCQLPITKSASSVAAGSFQVLMGRRDPPALWARRREPCRSHLQRKFGEHEGFLRTLGSEAMTGFSWSVVWCSLLRGV